MSYNCRSFKVGNKLTVNSISSGKKFANRTFIKTISIANESIKKIYQINKEGKIVKIWNSMDEISLFYNIDYHNIHDSIRRQKVSGDCLFVKMLDYKSTIDYSILIKYLKYKQKKTIK